MIIIKLKFINKIGTENKESNMLKFQEPAEANHDGLFLHRGQLIGLLFTADNPPSRLYFLFGHL